MLALSSFWGRIDASGLSRSLVCSREKEGCSCDQKDTVGSGQLSLFEWSYRTQYYVLYADLSLVLNNNEKQKNFEMLKLTQTWFLFLNYLESTYYFIHCWIKTFVDQFI